MAQWTAVLLIVLVCSWHVLRVLLAKIQGARRAAMPRKLNTEIGAMGGGCAGCNQCSTPCGASTVLATAGQPAQGPKEKSPKPPSPRTLGGAQATYQVLQFQPRRSASGRTH